MTYDLVIRNGTIVDGSGRPRYRADIGVTGDRIATIGRIAARGRTEVDAAGRAVAPGFIEVHSHMDAQVFWDPLGTSPVWHGVTTTIMGNCGFTLAPCREAEKDLCLRSLERAEDMPREALLAGIKWSWESYAEYLDAVDKLPKGINYAGLVGHSAIRTYVMGERAFSEAATDADKAAMAREVEAALRAGALGFSTSRSRHFTSDGRPVASRLAQWDEVCHLVDVMRRLDTGIFEITPDNWGNPEERARMQESLYQLAIASGRPMTFILLQFGMQGNAWREMMQLSERIGADGGRMMMQVIARYFTSVIGFRTHLPFDVLPTWAKVRAGSFEEQRRAFSDPGLRRKLVDEALHGSYATEFTGPSAQAPDYERLMVLDRDTPPFVTVAELARQRGTTPVDVMIDIALETDFHRFFVQPMGNFDLDDVLTMMRHPHSIFGGTDSGAHVSQLLDASMPSFILAYWVRERGIYTLEEAVRKMTFEPALTWGIPERGLVAPGMIADLVVFDPDTVSPGMPLAAHDLPAGALRLVQKGVGLAATVVSGQVVMRDNEPTGALPGRLLRGPLAARQ